MVHGQRASARCKTKGGALLGDGSLSVLEGETLPPDGAEVGTRRGGEREGERDEDGVLHVCC